MKGHLSPAILVDAMVIGVLSFILSITVLVVVTHNRNVANCRQTYETVDNIFRPFFPRGPNTTDRQRRNLEQFDRSIQDGKASCK